jgi:hypothetical protein
VTSPKDLPIPLKFLIFSLKIEVFRGKPKESSEVSIFHRNHSSSAEDLDFQLEISIFLGRLRSSPEVFNFSGPFDSFAEAFKCFAENFDFLVEIAFFADFSDELAGVS